MFRHTKGSHIICDLEGGYVFLSHLNELQHHHMITHTCTCTYTHTCTQTPTYTHTHTHTNTHTHTHTQTHTRTHTRTHTHMHMHCASQEKRIVRELESDMVELRRFKNETYAQLEALKSEAAEARGRRCVCVHFMCVCCMHACACHRMRACMCVWVCVWV